MVTRIQAVPSQSIAPQVTPSHHTDSTAADSGSAQVSRMVFCAPISASAVLNR